MTKRPVFCLMLLLWAPAAFSSEPAAVDKTQQPPAKNALAHHCKHMAQGPSQATLALPAVERQAAWLAEITEAAKAANVQGWQTFASTLVDTDPSQKQAWLESGVSQHGLQTECAVILKK